MAAKPAPGGSGEIASVVLLMCIGVVMHPSQIAGGGFAKVSPDGPVNGADFVQAGGVFAVVDAMANHAAHNAELAERTRARCSRQWYTTSLGSRRQKALRRRTLRVPSPRL